ncbi:hypothetical protein PRIPAC_96743 [Pristionchus pacificus]|uniref:Nep-4 n=1 Tax=Pristionchus pacificus TaxID=54126 RepID=A0A2A6BJY3_PRIPA|nr:hypothetical protein PRIPAC_96743 [Pristionchus pacificus]|eukprot:PDM66225.1 nep-4 [Pristionchus pacificus]
MDLEAKLRFDLHRNYDEVMEESGLKQHMEFTPNWILIIRWLAFLLGMWIGYWVSTKIDSPRPSAAEIRKGAYWRRKGEEEPTVDCEGELPVLLLFFLLPQLGLCSDRLKFHLENLVDRNISACDDFYHHACSQHVDPNEFFMERVRKIFTDAVNKFTPESDKNTAITYDLENADHLQFKHEDSMKNSPEREVIGDLITFMNRSSIKVKELNAVKFHKILQARIHIIEFMNSNNSFSDFHQIVEIAETMKERIIKNFKESPWLNRDDMSSALNMLTEKVKGIQVYHDFDEFDKNLTTLQKLNRDLHAYFFSVTKKSGVRGLDTLFGIDDAFNQLVTDINQSSIEMQFFVKRMTMLFDFNGRYYNEMNTVILLAPLIYKPSLCSEIIEEVVFKYKDFSILKLTQPIITYHALGHELYHSVFNPSRSDLLDLYGPRSQCIADHYAKSCTPFKVGACVSGWETFFEDAPDLESLRLLYGMLQDRYTDELTNQIAGTDTTMEQAFFYYAASGWCSIDGERTLGQAQRVPHSAKNIRINGAFSLMPEFSRAFGCKAGDNMHVEEQNSCYVFGPKSG